MPGQRSPALLSPSGSAQQRQDMGHNASVSPHPGLGFSWGSCPVPECPPRTRLLQGVVPGQPGHLGGAAGAGGCRRGPAGRGQAEAPRAPALPPGREAPLSSPPGAHWAGAEGPARAGGGNARGAAARRRLRGSGTAVVTGESRRAPPGGSARPGGPRPHPPAGRDGGSGGGVSPSGTRCRSGGARGVPAGPERGGAAREVPPERRR